MYGCSSLEILDLTPLKNISAIGSDYLADCDNLEAVNSAGVTWYKDSIKKELQDNYDALVYSKVVERGRKKFMTKTQWELLNSYYHPSRIGHFQYELSGKWK